MIAKKVFSLPLVVVLELLAWQLRPKT